MPDPKPLERDGDGGAARNKSLRDEFAGQALIGLVAQYTTDDLLSVERARMIAYAAYRMADAMILEGAK